MGHVSQYGPRRCQFVRLPSSSNTKAPFFVPKRIRTRDMLFPYPPACSSLAHRIALLRSCAKSRTYVQCTWGSACVSRNTDYLRCLSPLRAYPLWLAITADRHEVFLRARWASIAIADLLAPIHDALLRLAMKPGIERAHYRKIESQAQASLGEGACHAEDYGM